MNKKIHSDEPMIDIVKLVDTRDYSALMLAVRKQPSYIPQLLDAIKKLPDADKNTILKQTTSYDPYSIDYHNHSYHDYNQGTNYYNALMLAARYHPTCIPQFLESMKELTNDDKVAILKQGGEGGVNAFMLAVRYQPTCIPQFLEFINELTSDEQAAIFKQVDSKGSNALILAVLHQPTSIMQLLNAIETLPYDEDKAAIFNQKNCLEAIRSRLFVIRVVPDSNDQYIQHSCCFLKLAVERFNLYRQIKTNPAYKKHYISAFAHASELSDQCLSIYTDETKWEQWPEVIEKAQTTFKNDVNMLRVINQLDTHIHFYMRDKKRRDAFNVFKQWLQESDLPQNSLLRNCSKVDRSSLAPLLTAAATELNGNHRSEALTHLYALMKTYPEEDQRRIMNLTKARISDTEMSELYAVLDTLEKESAEKRLNGLFQEAIPKYVTPSAPPEEETFVAAAAELVKSDNYLSTYNQAGEYIDGNLVAEAQLMNAAEWVSLLQQDSKNITEYLSQIRVLDLDEQANVFSSINQNPKLMQQLNAHFKKNPRDYREFLLMELTHSISVLNGQKNQREYTNATSLHNNLTQLIALEQNHSQDPKKLNEVHALWHEFITVFKPTLSNLTPLLNKLAQTTPKAAATIANVKQTALKKPPTAPAIQPSPVSLSSEKKLYYEINNCSSSKVINDILIEQNPKHISFTEGTHNPLTLAFAKHPPAIPALVLSIAQLSDATIRTNILSQCNANHLSLISPTHLIDHAFKDNPGAKQALFLLELERITLSMNENEPAKPILKKLWETLNPLDAVLTNNDAKQPWVLAIKLAQTNVAIKQHTGLIHWFKSALGWAHKPPQGYGIGLFKPSINTLLDSMIVLPHENQAPKK